MWKGDTITVLPLVKRKGRWRIGRRFLTEEEHERLAGKIEEHSRAVGRIDLLERPDGLYYLPIKLPHVDEESNDLLDDDLYRAFEQGVEKTKDLTRSKWERLAKFGVIFFAVIFAVGAFLLFTVFVNKGVSDFGTHLSGVVKELNVSKGVLGVFGG